MLKVPLRGPLAQVKTSSRERELSLLLYICVVAAECKRAIVENSLEGGYVGDDIGECYRVLI